MAIVQQYSSGWSDPIGAQVLDAVVIAPPSLVIRKSPVFASDGLTVDFTQPGNQAIVVQIASEPSFSVILATQEFQSTPFVLKAAPGQYWIRAQWKQVPPPNVGAITSNTNSAM